MIREAYGGSLTNAALLFVAEEVERQGDRPLAVFWMAQAWALAAAQRSSHDGGMEVVPGMVAHWGKVVHPEANPEGFRKVNVRVGLHVAPHYSEVPRLVQDLCVAMREGLSPEESYKNFQEIHPFRDGNGRVGKILYSYLRGEMDAPILPPNFFGCANP